jgi:hypothetical protein
MYSLHTEYDSTVKNEKRSHKRLIHVGIYYFASLQQREKDRERERQGGSQSERDRVRERERERQGARERERERDVLTCYICV